MASTVAFSASPAFLTITAAASNESRAMYTEKTTERKVAKPGVSDAVAATSQAETTSMTPQKPPPLICPNTHWLSQIWVVFSVVKKEAIKRLAPAAASMVAPPESNRVDRACFSRAYAMLNSSSQVGTMSSA